MSKWFENKNEIIIYLLLSALCIATTFTLFYVFRPYLWAGILALLFYFTTRKTHKKLRKMLGVQFSFFSPYIMLILIITFLFLPFYLILSNLVLEALNLVNYIRNQLSEESEVALLLNLPFLTDFFTENEFFWINLPNLYNDTFGGSMDILNLDSLYGLLKNSSSFLLGSIDLPGAILFNLFFTFILLFFLYKEGSRIEHSISLYLPFPQEIEERLGRRIEDALVTVIIGNLLISILQGVMVYFIFLFTPIGNIILLASIASIFSLIPVIGTSIVWLPVGLYLGFVLNNWTSSIFVMLTGAAAYLILENYVKPKILDKKLKTHPFLIFLSLIGGLQEFGLAGIILGPMSLTLVIILWDFWKIYRETRFRKNYAG